MKKLILIFIFVSNLCNVVFCSTRGTPKIGIIGAGIGGTSTAYFWQQFFGFGAEVDIFEAEEVGGRLATTWMGQKEYETGGCILHPKNMYMSNFLDLLNLTERNSDVGRFGLYDGEDFVFAESNYDLITKAKLILRYGFQPLKLNSFIDELLDKFNRIYTLQDNGNTFNTVNELLQAMTPRFVDDLEITSADGFAAEGFSKEIIDELIMATIKTNYGQNLNAHLFVGSVSVAAASGGLWSVKGGNRQIPQKLLKLSKSKLISLPVTSITKLPSGNFRITTKQRSDIPIEETNYEYDIVVIAAPQTSDMKHKITFNNFPQKVEFPGRYHHTVTTLVRGTVNDRFFDGKREKYTDEILTTKDNLIFNSLSKVNPVNFDGKSVSNIWKVFSTKPLTAEEYDLMFEKKTDLFVKDWLAYPHYDTKAREDSFVIDDNLYHVNAIEWAASAMEMSVIGARNVALLSYKNWFKTDYKEKSESKREKVEL